MSSEPPKRKQAAPQSSPPRPATTQPATLEQGAGQLSIPELVPIAEFLEQSLPFNELPRPDLYQTVGKIVVQYHCRGDVFNRQTSEKGLRVVRSGAVEIRDSDNKLLDRLGEGESFHIAGLNAERGEVQATVIEDTLLYLLPDVAYKYLREHNRQFDRYFSGQRSRRLRRAARYQPEPNTMMQEVRTVMSTNLLTVSPQHSIQQTAQVMAQRRVSSAFIVDGGQLAGIVTDRDLRVRCVAKALSPGTAVSAIMTPDPQTIESSDTLFATTLLMTRRAYHHLPVMHHGELKGIVTTSDLILARQDDPVYLVQHISRQHDVRGIKELVSGMPNLMVQWVNSGMRAQQVSQILTAISDAITVRLIQLAEEKLGLAPVPWCWTGFGSQARGEQLLGADQDNGIIISNEVQPEHLPWYAQLATFVCDGLDACGYVYCPGDVMATTEEWRQPLEVWQQTVRRWVGAPTPDAAMRVSIFFDLRSIYGTSSLCDKLQKTMLKQASKNSIFLAALAANALDTRPPLGIFRRFVVDRDGEHRDSLDLKKRGVLPVTEIVRLHALAHKVLAVNTDERLKALAENKHMTIVDSRNLIDALHFIQHQRIKHQCGQILRGEKVTNFLNPRDLPKMAKEQLRDAFTIIDDAQSAVRQTYRAGMG
ncbi:MAG: cyclic nucleotide-binding/CBS domain-containing protein [Gammaproteobacteria bacterium]|nr:MAG: cyclic nucleotide-binding/CBS domain-containing protein [Gammaproteobacteria bacterium]